MLLLSTWWFRSCVFETACFYRGVVFCIYFYGLYVLIFQDTKILFAFCSMFGKLKTLLFLYFLVISLVVFRCKYLQVSMYFRLLPVHQHYLWVLAGILPSYLISHHHTSSHCPAASLNSSWTSLLPGCYPIHVCHATVLWLTTALQPTLPLPRLPSPVQHWVRHHCLEPFLAALFMDARTTLLPAILWKVPYINALVVLIKSRALVLLHWCHMRHGRVIDHVPWRKLQILQDTCTAWVLAQYIH